MIKVGVFCPHIPNGKFDMKYYLEEHMPMVRQELGSSLKGMAVEQGLSGGAPGAPITYDVMAHLTFDSVGTFQATFGAHAAAIMADIPNYTNIQPIVQVSDVKK
jgi:uncharacterized protein (TIGR02118 family)